MKIEKRTTSMSENGQAVFLLMMALLALFLTTGCGEKHRTYKETRTIMAQPAASESNTVVESGSQTQSTVEQTETTEASRPQGILSGVVHAAGQIIAFPFKLIGKVLGAIF